MKNALSKQILFLTLCSAATAVCSCGTAASNKAAQATSSVVSLTGDFNTVSFTGKDAVYQTKTDAGNGATDLFVFIGDKQGMCEGLNSGNYTGNVFFIDVYNPEGAVVTGASDIGSGNPNAVVSDVTLWEGGAYTKNYVQAQSGTISITSAPKTDTDDVTLSVMAADGASGKITGTITAVFCPYAAN